jgi:hypothetical protein
MKRYAVSDQRICRMGARDLKRTNTLYQRTVFAVPHEETGSTLTVHAELVEGFFEYTGGSTGTTLRFLAIN